MKSFSSYFYGLVQRILIKFHCKLFENKHSPVFFSPFLLKKLILFSRVWEINEFSKWYHGSRAARYIFSWRAAEFQPISLSNTRSKNLKILIGHNCKPAVNRQPGNRRWGSKSLFNFLLFYLKSFILLKFFKKNIYNTSWKNSFSVYK